MVVAVAAVTKYSTSTSTSTSTCTPMLMPMLMPIPQQSITLIHRRNVSWFLFHLQLIALFLKIRFSQLHSVDRWCQFTRHKTIWEFLNLKCIVVRHLVSTVRYVFLAKHTDEVNTAWCHELLDAWWKWGKRWLIDSVILIRSYGEPTNYHVSRTSSSER